VPRRKAPEGGDENEHEKDESSKSPPEKMPENNQPAKPDNSDSSTIGVDRYA